MTNVEKLKKNGSALGDVRQRLGAEDENDTSFDDAINAMSSSEIVAEYCAWRLGDNAWWFMFIGLFNELEAK